MTREWSSYQRAVFEEIENDNGGHVIVEALAGSGKTSTIVEALSHTRESDRVLMVAFNKAIAEELRDRVPEGVEVSTLHSFGLKAISKAMGRRKVDNYVVPNRLQALMGRGRDSYEARKAVAKLVSIAKGCLVEGIADLDLLADAYGIDFPPNRDRFRLLQTAARILEEAREGTSGPIDFDDMIYLPVVCNLPLPTFDFVFVDETQDLNRAQLEIVERAAGEEGRIVAVGDRRQAIYGFRGADSQAIPRMISKLEARVLPLSITYRCPRRVVSEAQRIVPSLEEAPEAPEGIVREASEEELKKGAASGDFVISRTNAPLIRLAWGWLREGRRAAIRGRDLASGLTTFVKNADAYSIRDLEGRIEEWRDREVARLVEAERDYAHIDDRADCLQAICEGCEEIPEVLEKISDLFSGDERGAILLTSTHRSKGLEADRVWLLRETFCKWPGIEEENLLYVAITRAKHELIYVFEEVSKEEEKEKEQAA